jgi:hypothetical protein
MLNIFQEEFVVKDFISASAKISGSPCGLEDIRLAPSLKFGMPAERSAPWD